MEIIAVQLDLGRQKERFDFIKGFVDNAKKWGYNTIILYIECSIRTKVTPFSDENDTYSLEEISIETLTSIETSHFADTFYSHSCITFIGK